MPLEITPILETEIQQRAAAEGMSTSQFIDRLLHQSPVGQKNSAALPLTHSVDPANDASIALLQSWLEEDATDDPEEIRAAEEELQEFMHNMNQPRKEAGARLLYPEVE